MILPSKLLHKKRILVTGGTGFIGSHLIESLKTFDCHIFVPYISIEKKSYFSVADLRKSVVLQKVNISDKKKIEKFITNNQIDYIFHLAAQTIVTTAYEDPYTTLRDNIMGTVNVLETMRQYKGIKGFIFASSDKAYGKTKTKYTEDSPLHGDHPYDVSKSSGDLIVHTYHKTYGMPVITARFGNIYGEGDLHMDRIIPGICEAIIKKRTFQIRSNGKYVRDYVYVKDVVDGYLLLASLLERKSGEAFNFSSSDSYSVVGLLRKIEKKLGNTIPHKILNSAKNEIPYQHLDDTNIRKLGWKTSHTLDTTINDIVDWYRKIL